jgi:hypothetical protein
MILEFPKFPRKISVHLTRGEKYLKNTGICLPKKKEVFERGIFFFPAHT